jgi:hypothetical protein
LKDRLPLVLDRVAHLRQILLPMKTPATALKMQSVWLPMATIEWFRSFSTMCGSTSISARVVPNVRRKSWSRQAASTTCYTRKSNAHLILRRKEQIGRVEPRHRFQLCRHHVPVRESVLPRVFAHPFGARSSDVAAPSFRKPSLYPAELRDRRARLRGAGAWRLHSRADG